MSSFNPEAQRSHRGPQRELLRQRSRSPLALLVRRLGRILLRLRILHVLVVPREIPFIPVLHVARTGDAVKLIWIDDQLRFHAQTAERLIHLLATLDRYVEVPLAAQ